MNKKILGIFVILFVVAILATPVFAVPPMRGTFSQVAVQVGVTPPDKVFVTDHINHERGAYSAGYVYSPEAPWGNSLPGTGSTQITAQLNLETYTGMVLNKIVTSYDDGMTRGTVNAKFTGIGTYFYNGPTFPFDLNGKSGTVTQGETYFGLLLTGFSVEHGISGDLKGLELTGRGTGVYILSDPLDPLNGVVVFETTVTYKLPG